MTRRPFRALAGATVLGSEAAVLVLGAGYRLVPDTASYASGGSWWSSPILALAGRIDGLAAVQALAVAAAATLGFLVGRRSLTAVFVLALLPPRFGVTAAGPDALGAAAVLLLWRRLPWWAAVPLTACAHLEAALVLAVVRILRRRGRDTVSWAVAAGAAAVVALPLIAVLRDAPLSEVQYRYLLPGLVAAARENL